MRVDTARKSAVTAARLLTVGAAIAAFAAPTYAFSSPVGSAAPATVEVAGHAPPPVGDGPIKRRML